MNKRSKKINTKKRKLIIIVVIIILLIGVMAILELTNTTHFFHKSNTGSSTITTPTPTTTSKSTSENKTVNPSTGSVTNNSVTGANSSTKTSAPTSTSATLTAPYGSFVSNHKPGQNGSNTQEQSTCLTTPGATCYIQFTNGSIVKTLAVGTADSDGAVYWNWDVSSAGFTTGSWQIEAIASLNGQTMSTSDQIPLVVQ